MESLPSELLSPILAQLSDTELLNLPTFVTTKGLTQAIVETRFSSYTISLDRAGLGRLYKLCSVPCIAFQVQEITILTDRVIKPTRAEFLKFQQNSRSHLTCPDMISQYMDEVHVHCEGQPCLACNGSEDSKLQESLAHAGDEQLEIEDKAIDLAMLAWALRRMVNLKHITIQSSFTRHRNMRLARKKKKWDKQHKRYCCHRRESDPRPGPLSECTDWDMRLDTQRVYVLVLKAMKMAKTNLEGTNRSRWVGLECDRNWNDICTSIDTDLQREQLEYDNAMKKMEGRQRDTWHAFHVWEKCLRRSPQNTNQSRV